MRVSIFGDEVLTVERMTSHSQASFVAGKFATGRSHWKASDLVARVIAAEVI